MSFLSGRYRILVFLIFLSGLIHAEGTKQLRPASGDFGYLQINDKGRTSATYAATPDERIYIRVNSNKEKIYFGFGDIAGAPVAQNDVWFRIKNKMGVVVMGPTRIPKTGNGYISSYARAVAGPKKINPTNGYNYLMYAPVDTGDYYIEFNQGSATNVTDPNTNKRVFDLFDITVIDTTISPIANGVKNGRVWSKNWDITTDGGANSFKGTLFVYSNDGVVTSINFNGVQPHAFRVACNATGCVDNRDPVNDRKSRAGEATYPSYKIFFNDPDNVAYPSGVIGSITTSMTITGCAPEYCINISTSAPGYVEFLVELNGIPGYQEDSKDLIFGQTIASGANCIPWDGKDGQGNQVGQSVNFEIQADYKFGLTNLPIFDVENFSGGFKVASIRPSVITPKLFWDDSNIPGGTTELVTGCSTAAGCHGWPSANFGDDRTINTWWYVNVQRTLIFTSTITKPTPSISGAGTTFCDTITNSTYQTTNIAANQYEWSIKRGTIVSGANSNVVVIKRRMGLDTLMVREMNPTGGCYEDTLFIQSYLAPDPSITGDTTICLFPTSNETYTTPAVAGNTYSWSINGGTIQSGGSTNSATVQWTTAGNRSISVTEQNSTSCSKTVTKNVVVTPKPATSNIAH